MNGLRWNLGGVLAASLLLGTLVGCGGSGSANNAPTGPAGSVVLAGGIVTQSATSAVAVNPSSVPQQIVVKIGAATTSTPVWIPAGVGVAAGQSISIIPAGATLIEHMGTGPKTNAVMHPFQSVSGDVVINNQQSGVTLIDGALNADLGLPAGSYTATLVGPFTVSNGAWFLTVGQFIFTFESNGVAMSFPTTIQGSIPSNGANTQGNRINLTFDPAFSSGPASMTVIDSNGQIHQTHTVNSDGATFFDLVDNDGKLAIPTAGVNTVTFSH